MTNEEQPTDVPGAQPREQEPVADTEADTSVAAGPADTPEGASDGSPLTPPPDSAPDLTPDPIPDATPSSSARVESTVSEQMPVASSTASGETEADAAPTPDESVPATKRGAALRGAFGGALGRFRRAPGATPDTLAAASTEAEAESDLDDSDMRPVPTIPTAPFARPTVLPSTGEAPLAPSLSTLDRAFEDDEPRTLQHPTPIGAHLVVLTGLATLVILGFLLTEPSPRWLLLLGAAAVVLGLEGTLRQTWREPFESGADTAPYLFVPAIYMIAVPVLIEHNVPGELAILAGLAAGAGFGALAWAELATVRPNSFEYLRARLIVTASTYLAGFAIFSLTYVFEVSLPAALAAVALAASMLAVEALREGEVDPLETLGFALVTGVVLAETRWLLYYLPLDRYLAGLTLLLAFYLVTGLLHSHITRAFSSSLATQYAAIAAAGLMLVAAARAAGLA